MKLWRISQDENNGYDVYDSAVVAAETEADARVTMPNKYEAFGKPYGGWCSGPDKVKVELIGEAAPHIAERCIILASFNAG